MLEVITGPMFSGKTEELIRRLRRAEIAGKTTAVIKHKFDTRYDAGDITSVSSHSGNRIPCIAIHTAREIEEYQGGWDVLGIDEAQFFEEELCRVVRKLADSGTRVIVAGLDMTFRREAFGPIPILMATSDKVDKLTAVCAVCGDDAGYTQRLIDGEPAGYDEPTVKVGALESYQARCLWCFQPGS